MEMRGINPIAFEALVTAVSEQNYAGNLILNRFDPLPATSRRPAGAKFTLRVQSSRGPGHRLSWGGNGTGQRRLVSACWHAHRDVMRAVFDLNPEARIKSAFADYDGEMSFNRQFPDTYHRNVGSMMEPAEYGSLCDCDE